MSRIKLLFTSDEHGRFKRAGQMQSLIRREKKENPNTFLLSAGDVFQGTPESDLQGGYPSLDILDKAGYDVVEIGNHDFDNGLPFLKEWVETAPYPVLGANIIDQSTGKRLEGTKAYQILEANGAKVGLIGVVTPETPESTFPKSNVEGLEFADPVETVRKARDELKELGVDVVGVLSHLGADDDLELAESVDGLGFILGGHTHQAFQQPKEVNGTLVCQPGAFREYLGSLEFDIDPVTDQISDVEHELIPVEQGEMVESDPVSKAVSGHMERINKINNTVVSHCSENLTHEHHIDGNLDHVLAEAVTSQTGADVFMVNRKTLRANLPKGDVTAGQLYKSLPFTDKIVTFKVGRDKLKGLLNQSESYADHRSLLHTGVGFEKKPKGEIQNIGLNVDGSYHHDPDFVNVATVEFLADGGLGYDFGDDRTGSHPKMRDLLEAHLDLSANEALGNVNANELFASLKTKSK